MLKLNTAITARRCSTAITLVRRRPNTQHYGRGRNSPFGRCSRPVKVRTCLCETPPLLVGIRFLCLRMHVCRFGLELICRTNIPRCYDAYRLERTSSGLDSRATHFVKKRCRHASSYMSSYRRSYRALTLLTEGTRSTRRSRRALIRGMPPSVVHEILARIHR